MGWQPFIYTPGAAILTKNGAADQSLGMAAPASRSIVALASGGYQLPQPQPHVMSHHMTTLARMART
jgi:hypothetical protein